ncbi:hypothetical protein Aperf_G00000104954 [Anoplocephala perfoliata]
MSKESLQNAYVDYVLPLPCRDILSVQKSSSINKEVAAPDMSNLNGARRSIVSANQRLNPQYPNHVKQKRKECDLDSLVIISNPNWPTSGVNPLKKLQEAESKINENLKRSSSDAISLPGTNSSSPQPAAKRPKINRNFSNLAQFICKDKVL